MKVCVSLSKELTDKLIEYMDERNIKTKSGAIRDCVNRIVNTKEFQDSVYEINQKLNRILYRQSQSKKVQDQFFANFGFGANEPVEDDEALKEVYTRINKYTGRFD